MPLFQSPTSFRLVQEMAHRTKDQLFSIDGNMSTLGDIVTSAARPDFGHLTLLVFEAVLEVVCVSLPGYIVARLGMFDAEAQKFLANLNVMLFTPCLIFTKLASQLNADKLTELAIIPVIFIVQTVISYSCAYTISKFMGFKKRQSNFVIAMGVFGNSNSLPISLVISLSQTLKGLHWSKIPGDNDDEVGARGILYLLIFQQLGQLVRWTWGYNVLLAPADRYSEADGGTMQISQTERGQYRDDPEEEQLLSPDGSGSYGSIEYSNESPQVGDPAQSTHGQQSQYNYGPSPSSSSDSLNGQTRVPNSPELMPSSSNGSLVAKKHWQLNDRNEDLSPIGMIRHGVVLTVTRVKNRSSSLASSMFHLLPKPLQTIFRKIGRFFYLFLAGLWEFMNPPLWAMVIAIIVASVPQLQHLFFDPGTFVRNSVTRAVQQSAGVAVPLILVVLGGNLARNTLPKASAGEVSDPKEERKLLIASIVSRMVMPTVIMAPLLALTAKYVQVSILDDKIFIIVCFLLTGAPTALQLAQICQLNNVYMPVMSNILFQSYVIWILPSTLFLVMVALETVAWAES